MNANSANKPGILLAANWDSNVGYAWWLIESYWANIARHYSQTHKIYLCYPSISKIPPAIEQSAIQIEELDFTPEPKRLAEQRLFIKNHNIKCIYFSDRPAYNINYLFYHLFGVKKIIVHDHTPGLRTPPGLLKGLFKKLLNRLPLVNLDAYIGATTFIQQRGIDVTCIPEEKTYSVNNGIPINQELQPADIHSIFQIQRGRSIIVSTGRAHEYKGIPFLLRCLAKIIHEQNRKSLHFFFCGDGPHLEQFKQLTHDLKISEYVTMPGRVDNINSIIAACDFAVHPSSGEVGYSLSILEYMLSGLAVIVPDNPSVCGATNHNKTGLVYGANNIEAACNAITELLDAPEKARDMGKNAKSAILDSYSIENTHRQLTETMQHIYPK